MNKHEKASCKGGPHELAKRFIGTWEEFTVNGDKEILEGTLETQFELGGCVLTQRFLSVNEQFSFMSFAHVEPKTNTWSERYVFNNGRSTQWRWSEAEDEIIMYRTDEGKEDRRLRVVNLTDNAYDVIEEHLMEGDKGWQLVELTRTRRIK